MYTSASMLELPFCPLREAWRIEGNPCLIIGMQVEGEFPSLRVECKFDGPAMGRLGAGHFRTQVSAPPCQPVGQKPYQACNPALKSQHLQPFVIVAEHCNFMPTHKNWRDSSQSLLLLPLLLLLEQF